VPATPVSADPRFPLLWSARGDTIIASANGHGWTMRKTPGSLRAIKALAAVRRTTVGEILQCAAGAHRRELRRVVQTLADWRWLIRE